MGKMENHSPNNSKLYRVHWKNSATDIQTEEGLITALIYDDSKKHILDDLAETATLLKETSDALQNGDGTAALLMRDPALYEDLRSLVGGAHATNFSDHIFA